MSFPSWLQNLLSAPAPRRGQDNHGQQVSVRAATLRPSLEVLEDRSLPSFGLAGSFSVGTNPQAMVTADFNNDGLMDLVVGLAR